MYKTGAKHRPGAGVQNGHFGGGGSFMSNGYAIWSEGLNGEPPNPYAIAQGNTQLTRMFYIRSQDSRASYRKFIDFLEQIQQKEATKERLFVQKKLDSLPDFFPDDKEHKAAVQKAIDSDNFGLAYSLLLERNKTIDELKREMTSSNFDNISHTNSFWADQFSTFFERKMADLVEIKGHQLVKKVGSNPNVTIGSLVDEWLSELLYNSDGATVASFEPLREKMKDELLSYFQKAGIKGVNSYADSIFGKTGNITSLTKRKTTKKMRSSEDKKLSSVIRAAGDAIGNAVGKGIAAEASVAGRAGRSGAAILNTGTMLKEIKNEFSGAGYHVQQKADNLIVEMFDGTFDLRTISQEIYKEIIQQPDASLKKIQEYLKKYGEKNGVQDIFMVEVNVKGYRSKRDLTIEGEGTFERRASNLVKMSQEATGMPALSMEKLIFMLNNTVSGCIAENNQDYLTDYLTAVCVAWMWDDYEELFSVDEMARSGAVKRIRLFNSGGFFYSASQIMKQTIDNLVKGVKHIDFAKVEITPPSFNANNMYSGLKKQFPLPPHDSSKEEWQGALAQRWDAMRNYIMQHGTISIKFRQEELEKLLGNLQTLL